MIARQLATKTIDAKAREVSRFAGSKFFVITRSEGLGGRQSELDILVQKKSIFSQFSSFAQAGFGPAVHAGASGSSDSDLHFHTAIRQCQFW